MGGISHGDKFGNLKKKLQKFGTGYFARGQIREPQKKIAEVWHGVFRTGTNSGTSKKNCRSLARGISHRDKFGNLIGTCGRVAAEKSDNVWHWHQACEWAMLKKKLQKFGTGYFAPGQIREPHKKIAEVWHGVFRTGANLGTPKKKKKKKKKK